MTIKRFLLFFIFLIIFICGYGIISAVIIGQTTGILHIKSSDANSALIISQSNRQAKVLGKGAASVRLKPGVYEISASNNGYQTVESAQIYSKQSKSIVIQLAGASRNASSSQLFNKLPFLGPSAAYQIINTVQASGNASGPLIIITSTNSLAQETALQWIRNEGFNPADYNIQFKTAPLVNYHYTNGLP
jgi:hypothetical protein